MADLKITKISEAEIFIDGPPNIIKELVAYFTVFSPNYRFNPKVRNGYWDGKLKLFSTLTQKLPIGLLCEVENFCRNGGYTIEKDFSNFIELELEDFNNYVESLNIQLPDNGKPRKYQLAAVWDAITKKHLCVEVPTSGGKTLISYLICRFLLLHEKKILLIVPTTTLVEQTYNDWYDYGWRSVRDYVHRLYGGQKKHFDSPITISTWQSIYKDPEIFELFDCLFVDEAHSAKAKSLKNISAWCVNAEFRLGTSGTYIDKNDKDKRCEYMTIVGALGPIKKYVTYQEMMDNDWIANLNITCLKLKYPLLFKKNNLKVNNKDYPAELDMIHNYGPRNDFIEKLINSKDKNVLVLFTKNEKHGDPLYKKLKKGCPDKHIIYINGSVDTTRRTEAKRIAEKNDNVVILASYGTFSTGISIKNIHYLVFASGYKSKIKVLQSIGRGLRRLKGKKTEITLYDIVDDCSVSPSKDKHGNKIPGYKNHSLRHFNERKKIYDEVGFRYKIIEYKLPPEK